MRYLLVALLLLAGCGTYKPCWYGHKAVTQREANHMKNLGMDVKCPGDETAKVMPCGPDDCGKAPIP